MKGWSGVRGRRRRQGNNSVVNQPGRSAYNIWPFPELSTATAVNYYSQKIK